MGKSQKLEKACVYGKVKKVKSLLKKGAKITDDCMTLSIRCRYTKIVKILLKNGFDLSSDKEGWWINWAIMCNCSKKMVKILIKYGATISNEIISFVTKCKDGKKIMKILAKVQ